MRYNLLLAFYSEFAERIPYSSYINALKDKFPALREYHKELLKSYRIALSEATDQKDLVLEIKEERFKSIIDCILKNELVKALNYIEDYFYDHDINYPIFIEKFSELIEKRKIAEHIIVKEYSISIENKKPDIIGELLPEEWAVDVAKNKRFLEKIRALYDFLKEQPQNEGAEIVITLYAKSFPGQKGVGTFEYDLLYYRNIIDDSPMFGPIVINDDRIKFTQNTAIARKVIKEISPDNWKKGGFIEREKIRSAAMFKLGGGLWQDSKIIREEGSDSLRIEEDDISGLLFINGRGRSLFRNTFDREEFYHVLSEIENEILLVKKERFEEFKQRRFLVSLHSHSIDKYIDKSDINLEDISKFFSNISEIFMIVSKNNNVSFTIYGYEKRYSRKLIWLWSNSPTSTNAIIPLSFESLLLMQAVAKDPNHKPLLIHNLQQRKEYQNRAIRTKLRNRSQTNLVVPILSYPSSENELTELLGIIDIQGTDATQFDTYDVQLIYELSAQFIWRFLSKIFAVKSKEKFYTLIPLHNQFAYNPFPREEPDFQIHELLNLNFNPMKLFLHWDKVRELITSGVTKRPSLVEIWPNMICNHHCTWCRTFNDRMFQRLHKKEMTEEDLLGIARDLKTFDNVDILISGGGEPLLHAHIGNFVKEVKDVKGIFGIFTNGTRPKDPHFWEYFLDRKKEHSFVRISFNGHDPESYYKIHGINKENLPPDFRSEYAEARKTVIDLLGMRSPRCSVALGDTILNSDISVIPEKAEHARHLGVDFIQMRPELWESSQHNDIGDEVCQKVKATARAFDNDKYFAVVHTDAERSFMNHDEDTCYAMNLVPALVPDKEEGWIRVMPCSYAINKWGKVPDLGRMKSGTKLSDFWEAMNKKLSGGTLEENDNIEVTIEKPIVPREGCPQCRYFRLNKRIQAIKDHSDKINLIDQLVKNLYKDPDNLDNAIVKQIEETWDKNVIDFEQIMKAFKAHKKLNIKPSF